MHPKSRDRTGNRQLIDRVSQNRRGVRTATGPSGARRSPYGARLEAARNARGRA